MLLLIVIGAGGGDGGGQQKGHREQHQRRTSRFIVILFAKLRFLSIGTNPTEQLTNTVLHRSGIIVPLKSCISEDETHMYLPKNFFHFRSLLSTRAKIRNSKFVWRAETCVKLVPACVNQFQKQNYNVSVEVVDEHTDFRLRVLHISIFSFCLKFLVLLAPNTD